MEKKVKITREKKPKTKVAKEIIQEPILEPIPTTVSRRVEIVKKRTEKRTTYYIANSGMADIICPLPGRGGLKANALVFPAGRSTLVSADDWNTIKQRSGVARYIDVGLLTEVSNDRDVPVLQSSVSSPIIPEHLLRDDEVQGNATDVKASVRRKNVTSISI